MLAKLVGSAGLVCLTIGATIQFGAGAGWATAGAALLFAGIDAARPGAGR